MQHECNGHREEFDCVFTNNEPKGFLIRLKVASITTRKSNQQFAKRCRCGDDLEFIRDDGHDPSNVTTVGSVEF
jgi:hypothetical protein